MKESQLNYDFKINLYESLTCMHNFCLFGCGKMSQSKNDGHKLLTTGSSQHSNFTFSHADLQANTGLAISSEQNGNNDEQIRNRNCLEHGDTVSNNGPKLLICK